MKNCFVINNPLAKAARNSRVLAMGVFALLMGITQPTFAKTIHVTTSAEEGEGSFSAALFQANNAEESSEIVFNIPETDSQFPINGGNLNIFITKPLPEIKSAFPVTISGKNITLDGSKSLSKFSALTILSSNHQVSGFTIKNFGLHGILVQGESDQSVENITLKDLFISENGTFDENGNIGDGIQLTVNVTNSQIFNNTISRNNGNGIFLQSLTTDVKNNRLFDNRVLGNQKNGIRVEGSQNIFGINNNQKPAGNLVADNNLHGYLFSGNFANNNQLAYDFIGTDQMFRDQGNRLDGIRAKLGAHENQFGPNLKIHYNGGGIIIMGAKSVANKIIENDIIQNKSEGILLEKIVDEPSNPTNIFQNNILKNIGNGITLHGSSPTILQNQISKNEDHAIELLVHDDGTPDVLTLQDETYSTPTIQQNIISDNDLGGIFALDTIFRNWEHIEKENEFSQANFDVQVKWLQILEINKTHDSFSYLQAEISACKENGTSCLGSELRENDGKYYLGPHHLFNPKNRDTFFEVIHFSVVNGERQTFSPHQIKITGAAEKILTLNDRIRVDQVLNNNQEDVFHSSAPKNSAENSTTINNSQLAPNLFNLGEIRQKQAGKDSFWLIISALFALFTYHFWKVGRKVMHKRIQQDAPKKKRKTNKRKTLTAKKTA